MFPPRRNLEGRTVLLMGFVFPCLVLFLRFIGKVKGLEWPDEEKKKKSKELTKL